MLSHIGNKGSNRENHKKHTHQMSLWLKKTVYQKWGHLKLGSRTDCKLGVGLLKSEEQGPSWNGWVSKSSSINDRLQRIRRERKLHPIFYPATYCQGPRCNRNHESVVQFPKHLLWASVNRVLEEVLQRGIIDPWHGMKKSVFCEDLLIQVFQFHKLTGSGPTAIRIRNTTNCLWYGCPLDN